ncbi:MAG: DUF488 domain-containing protein [Streptosporangiaceae bacterium]
MAGAMPSAGRRRSVTADIRVGRVYDDPAPADGARVLVDRIWPRGLRKDAARLDDWAKDAAPSTDLRTWYQHDPAKFSEFRRRYVAELTAPPGLAAIARLRALAAAGPVTLLSATRDIDISQAAVLADLLRQPAPR